MAYPKLRTNNRENIQISLQSRRKAWQKGMSVSLFENIWPAHLPISSSPYSWGAVKTQPESLPLISELSIGQHTFLPGHEQLGVPAASRWERKPVTNQQWAVLEPVCMICEAL